MILAFVALLAIYGLISAARSLIAWVLRVIP